MTNFCIHFSKKTVKMTLGGGYGTIFSLSFIKNHDKTMAYTHSLPT